MNGRILVVDDEAQIRRAVGRALAARDYVVESTGDGEDAVNIAATFAPDLIVLDLNLPTLDGLAVCRRIRSHSSVPILVLSVRADETDKVEALDLGADDYLTKPFGTDELLARVRALLRRSDGHASPPTRRFHHGSVDIDLDDRVVRRDGEVVRLTKTEWALVETMAQHPGRLLTHHWLLERVWGPGYADDVELLRVFVSQLRRKIEPDSGRPEIIVTDPGIGYRWIPRPLDEAKTENG